MKTTPEQRAALRESLDDGWLRVKDFPAVTDALDDLDAALAMLRRREWYRPLYRSLTEECLFCGKNRGEGHAADCELAALLKAADDPTPDALPPGVTKIPASGRYPAGYSHRAADAPAPTKEPTTCGHCTYEEADGGLIEQCEACRQKDAPATGGEGGTHG